MRLMIANSVVRLAALVLVAGPVAAQTSVGTGAGAFQMNDQIALEVEGDTQFTHTFTVGPGPALVLPVIGPIALAGVRRGEAEAYLTQQLGRYVKNPVVHAKVLVRLAVLGEVEHAGFYAVPAAAVVSDALMAAGGLTKDARLSGARIERGSQALWAGDALQEAVARGMTVEGMGLRTGDRIIVPKRGDAETTIRIIGMLAGIPAAIFVATRVIH